jgi:hypothetical protein
VVDSGGSLSNDRTIHGELRGSAIARNKWVLKAYERFTVDAANLSGQDLSALLSMQDAVKADGESRRFLDRLVLANIAKTPRSFLPKPFRVVGVTDRSGKPVRISFVGLASRPGSEEAVRPRRRFGSHEAG